MPGIEPAASARGDDIDLAGRIAAGDSHAFETLMRRHNRMLYRLARSILRNDADAEDALQDAYVAAYRNIRSFHATAKISTWLARIVINEAYARLRAQKSRDVVVPIASYGSAGQQPMEESATMDTTTEMPEDAASRSELRGALERKIDELPEQFRTAFMLREVEEMSAEEAAECLGIPVSTVRTRAFRARALLRESLAREMDIATINAFGFAGERCNRIVARVLARLETLRASATS
jgi:RNA polymerase sigma-70 factor (ECF subfamily)